MKSHHLKWALLVGLVSGFGCTVTVHGPPPPRVVVVESAPPPPPPPPPATEIVITQDDEVHYVVYREYFGCTEAEIYAYPHYRRYYAISDDDIYFITFVARRRGIAFDVCFRNYYYDCGRNYDRLIVSYNMPRATFFCSVNVGVTTYPPIYQRTYVAYQQNNVTNITIQNNEYVALVHMKVGVEYQGHPPATFFAQVNANGGNTSKVIVANKESCGKGGTTATGAKVTATAPRPWTMPPAQKQAWHDDHKAQVVKHEDTFKDVHKDQVQKVQAQAPKKATDTKGPAASGQKHEENAPAKGAQAQEKPHAAQEKPHTEENKPKGAGAPPAKAQEGGAKAAPAKPEEHQKPKEEPAKKAPPKEQPKKGEKEEEKKKGEK
jgi:hypothetical protein